jgi:hypothetical protein
MQTLMNDSPVLALFIRDVPGGGKIVECRRCKAHTMIPRGEFASPPERLFDTRCSYCEARLKYPKGAS